MRQIDPRSATTRRMAKTVRNKLNCPVGRGQPLYINREGFITACKKIRGRAGSTAGVKGSSRCDVCRVAKLVDSGKHDKITTSHIPEGITLFSNEEFAERKTKYNLNKFIEKYRNGKSKKNKLKASHETYQPVYVWATPGAEAAGLIQTRWSAPF